MQSLVSLVRGDLNSQQLGEALKNLNPAFRYMRVELDGAAPALMVLGYTDQDRHGAVEVWYSALGEVVRTQSGRIVGTVGLPVDWRALTYLNPPIAWTDAMAAPATYQRARDELPSYRFGVQERVTLSAMSPLLLSSLSFEIPVTLRRERSTGVRWFREQVDAAGGSNLPDALFAVARYRDQDAVVFSRQCLSDKVCLRMQLWPPQEESL